MSNEKEVDAGIYAANDDKKGYAYDANGNPEIQVGVNVKNTDISDSGEVINVVFHETTDTEKHSRNEDSAEYRGDLAERIWNMKNHGNENTNKITGEKWYENNQGHVVIGAGNNDYFGSRGEHMNSQGGSNLNYYDMEKGLVEQGDTWETIAKEINDFYGIKLSIEDLQKINSKDELEELIIGESVVAGTITDVRDGDGNIVSEEIWKVEYDKDKIDLGYWNGLTYDQMQITHYQRNNFYDYEGEDMLGTMKIILDNPNATPGDKKVAQDWIDRNFTHEGDTGTHNVGVDEKLPEDQRNQDYRGKPGTDYVGQQFIWNPRDKEFVRIDTNAINGGTYDYVTPGVFTVGGHFEMDVDPWLAWGNTPENRLKQSMSNRVEGLKENSFFSGGNLGHIAFNRTPWENSLYSREVKRLSNEERWKKQWEQLEYERAETIWEYGAMD